MRVGVSGSDPEDGFEKCDSEGDPGDQSGFLLNN
jgi:hypothetical protein